MTGSATRARLAYAAVVTGHPDARWLADTFGTRAAAALVAVDRRTLARWANGDSAPADGNRRRLSAVTATARLLVRGLTTRGTAQWFELPNRNLDGETPRQALDGPDAGPRLRRAALDLIEFAPDDALRAAMLGGREELAGSLDAAVYPPGYLQAERGGCVTDVRLTSEQWHTLTEAGVVGTVELIEGRPVIGRHKLAFTAEQAAAALEVGVDLRP
jgi:hypothetical protein